MRYLLTGDAFDAATALDLNLINEITTESPLNRAIELAEHIAQAAPLAVQATLASAKEAAEHGLIAATAKSAAVERALRQETLALLRRLQSLRAAAAAYPKGSLEALEKGLNEAERQLKVGRLALISYLELEAEAAETRETLLSLGLEQAHVLVDLQALAGAVDAPPALLAEEGSLLIDRQALHAHRLRFSHPLSGQPLELCASLPGDMARTLDALRTCRPVDPQARGK